MKLWDKGITIDKKIENFTVGKDRELDIYLAKYDAIGSKAHANMLCAIGLLPQKDNDLIQIELDNILLSIEQNKFEIQDGVEDVHSQIEFILTEKLGDIGKKIHSARSRNDQVLLDLKLFIKSEIVEIATLVRELFDSFIAQSEKYKHVLMPGYTHTQIAMPSSFGLWFGAFAESLIDDIHMLDAAHKIADQNPLGSAAGYGSSFPIDRQMTTQELKFAEMSYNVIYAQAGRGKTEKSVAFAISSIASTLSKFSADCILFNSQNFGFITLPVEFTTGSSIMPHKKNPDVFEVMRAKTNKLQALPTEIGFILSNLTTGYHRDLQIIKESFINAVVEIKSCLEILNFSIKNIQPNDNILQNEMYKYMFSVEEVNKLVLNGMPFRDAYKKIGADIENNTFAYSTEINHTHIGSIGDLSNDKIVNKMDNAIANLCSKTKK